MSSLPYHAGDPCVLQFAIARQMPLRKKRQVYFRDNDDLYRDDDDLSKEYRDEKEPQKEYRDENEPPNVDRDDLPQGY